MRQACAAWLAAFSVFCAPAAAQPSATEGESHILSAFTSGADPSVLADNVRVGPTLRARLGEETAGTKIYHTLVEHLAGRPMRVNLLRAADAARHATLVGSIADPLIVLEADELSLLLQYAPKEKRVTFIEQLSGPRSDIPPSRKVAAPQLPPQLSKPAPVVEVPLPTAPPATAAIATPPAVAAPKPAPVAPAPVTAGPAIKPPPPVSPKTAAPSAPATEAHKQAECVIKPVMTDEDLRACGAR